MKFRIALTATAALLLGTAADARKDAPTDADTRAWWAITGELSGDAMAGRDTGSPGYDRAAALVAAKFAAAGLKPAGEGGWYQQVPMHEIAVRRSTIAVGNRPLRLLYDLALSPSEAMPTTIDAGLVYRGYCGADAIGDVRGKLVICHGTHRDGLPSGAAREAAVRKGGGVGMLTIADPGFAVEPPRWPYAYSRSVTLADAKLDTDPFVRMTLNAASLATLIGPARRDAAALIAKGSAGRPLPNFYLADRFHATFTLARRRIQSANVLGMLPGTDPALAGQAIVLSAHLDGYGHGEPVNGDGLYNGTLDDAAYVALLIREAQRLQGRGLRRPILFAAFTGEEKGLLGARWFVAHPTSPKPRIAADINLDQLRPIFPLKLLTVHALDTTTLGDDVRAVAEARGIAVQRDPEPERNLLRRADHWPFLQAGIPATAFVFGYKPGTKSEAIYRQWYKTGYHKPQDDLDQLIDWQAAADFNGFFYALVARVAGQDATPRMVAAVE
ncbi:M28 family peptidase [Sphingomonas oligophenolica]|uniref:M28 family peptidase n=1 Tax=Sphingomonas oligophenolica TaxID=301154 RepID=A0A502CHL0_9SPHN|nr:M28 family peptidase [Sphingomonas oligophenolica]TPG12293.1 M28 family peptidase [Sphingomonas oligophenolica]